VNPAVQASDTLTVIVPLTVAPLPGEVMETAQAA
jgi:hypothetical protein